jgi:hypothetical protein
MRRIVNGALIALFSLTLLSGKEFCGIKNFAFKANEIITYKVYYHFGIMNAGAGEATFSAKLENLKGKTVYHVVGDGSTYSSYDWFFKVRDKYESYIDTATMLPLKFVRNVNEGGYKIYNNVSFNHSAGNAVSTNGVYKIPACTQDVLSTIYYARNINFDAYKAGDKIPFDMYIDDKVYSLYVKYLGKEKIKIGLGTFNAVKFRPLLISGTLFSGGEKMVVWATDDKNHVPLRIESPITVGDIRVDLIKYNNLRHPLSSKIK